MLPPWGSRMSWMSRLGDLDLWTACSGTSNLSAEERWCRLELISSLPTTATQEQHITPSVTHAVKLLLKFMELTQVYQATQITNRCHHPNYLQRCIITSSSSFIILQKLPVVTIIIHNPTAFCPITPDIHLFLVNLLKEIILKKKKKNQKNILMPQPNAFYFQSNEMFR